MVAYQVIGKPMPRVDGELKVTGSARYAADIIIPGTLYGMSLKSPYAHARIKRIDTSAAKALPGVHAVITGEDVRGAGLWGRLVKDVPVIADGYVRWAGERVAAVAADDEDIAQRALDLIEVEYEELTPVLDPEEAMKPEAPILHPDFNSYQGFRPMEKLSNVYRRTHYEQGNVEQGFAEADFVYEHTYVTQRRHQGYLEPQCVLVNIDKSDGRTHVWLCSKVPYNTRESLATAAREPEQTFLFHHVYIGGDFGGKGNSRNTPVAYYLAKATGRPVKIVSDYLEEFGAGNPQHHTISHLKTGVKKDGTITAHTVMYIVNSGAYAGFKPGGTIGGANQAAGPYRIPNCTVDSAFVYTNNIPGGFMRAPGEAQGVFAAESHFDEVARRIGMDPLEFKLKNLVGEHEACAFGEEFEHCRAKEAMQAAADSAGYSKPKAPFVGRGVAIGDRGTGGGEGTTEVRLYPDGRVVVGTPIFDQGTGTYTTLVQVVSEELRLNPEEVEIEIWETDELQFDSGVAGSRATRVNTIAAYEASQSVKQELLKLAVRYLGWPEGKLVWHDDEIRRTDLEEAIRWQDLVARSGETVQARAHVNETARSHITSFAAQCAEVSVDPETGEIKVLNFTSAHDIGQIVHPVGHQGQINGSVVQGLGYALMEELKVDEDGRVTTLSFGDYKMPTIRDLPPLNTVLLPSQAGVGPYNIRGIGEPPITPVAPAIANAIRDAVGVRIASLPLTSEKVYKALKESK
ncbi:MAG TPA: xanthine dehydrogenase family protein molybdopterin-binding subunit [Dehalococcoidia bacterium]|nr:xanthine dehydrogenase family protein molybdopterin-binding subunit [Dehalococcoidia bacterium]